MCKWWLIIYNLPHHSCEKKICVIIYGSKSTKKNVKRYYKCYVLVDKYLNYIFCFWWLFFFFFRSDDPLAIVM